MVTITLWLDSWNLIYYNECRVIIIIYSYNFFPLIWGWDLFLGGFLEGYLFFSFTGMGSSSKLLYFVMVMGKLWYTNKSFWGGTVF